VARILSRESVSTHSQEAKSRRIVMISRAKGKEPEASSRCSKQARDATAHAIFANNIFPWRLAMRCGTLGMHARHIQLTYSYFFSSLNQLASYFRTMHLSSFRLLGTRTRRSLQRSGRSCQLDSCSLRSPARKYPCRYIFFDCHLAYRAACGNTVPSTRYCCQN
jgi:hypothetical protein